MGWLSLIGSFKFYDSFAEYNLFYRAVLQKRPMFLGSLLIVATSYHASADQQRVNNLGEISGEDTPLKVVHECVCVCVCVCV